jgi:small acid-soluble spore protein F (minor alpha/beta-type SASP)
MLEKFNCTRNTSIEATSTYLTGGGAMSQKNGIVSDEVKYEIAKELGFADRINVQNGNYDYSNITTREAGLIVRGLLQKAEKLMTGQG